MKFSISINVYDLYGALVDYGAGCQLVETEEEAIELLSWIDKADNLCFYSPKLDFDEFETVCKHLDLQPKQCQYCFSAVNGSVFYFCFKKDYTI